MRILVVEDNHKIAGLIKRELQRENYVVDLAYDGLTGLDMAKGDKYELFILDWLIPGIDGLTLCKKIRDSGSNTPIMMLTAKGQEKNKIDGLDSGADDYMVKPFSIGEMLARVRALIRRPHPITEKILTSHDLELNTETFEVRRSGQAIKLSRKEFLILKHLMFRKNYIVTKEQLINSVWDYNAIVGPNNVEVYINRLRKKIDEPFAQRLITTEKGFGYRISDV